MATCGKDGCRAHALRGDDLYCFNHSNEPDVIIRRQAARSKGGRRRGKAGDAASIVSIDGIDDLKAILADALNDLRGSGSENIVGKARAVGYLVNVAAGLIKDGDFEERLEKLEDSLSESMS